MDDKHSPDDASEVAYASTRICPETDRLLEHQCKKTDRTRAYVIRQILNEWARKYPGAKRNLIT